MVDRDAIHAKFLELRNSFMERLEERLAEIEASWQAVQESGWAEDRIKELHRLTHNLVGTGRQFGYGQLSERVHAIEKKLNGLLEHKQTPDEQVAAQITSIISNLWQSHVVADEPVGGPGQLHTLAQWPQGAIPSRRAYLVEDDAEVADEIAGQIGRYGYDVRVFSNPEQFEAIVVNQPPTVVIMDTMFPGNDLAGTDIIHRIQRGRIVPLPVIFVSSRNDLEARLAAVRAGGDAYFTKPVDIASLVDRMDVLTGSREPKPYRVLVVDDDWDLANFYCEVLHSASMDAEAISIPMDIMAILAEFQPDLLLLDVYMPECTGLELAKVLRQQDAYLNMPIVFLSTERNLEKQFAALRMGGDAFLTKPIQDSHLISAVQAHARRSRALASVVGQDSLTGLLNHKKVEEQLELELLRAVRQQTPLAFAILDIDHFKQVNNTYGHLAGDRVIKNLAQMLQHRLRRTDSIGRCGGKKFAVILPGIPEQAAVKMMDELRRKFAQMFHVHDGKVFTVTFSGGVTGCPGFHSAVNLNKSAGDTLYEAKRTGRNRIIAASASINLR